MGPAVSRRVVMGPTCISRKAPPRCVGVGAALGFVTWAALKGGWCNPAGRSRFYSDRSALDGSTTDARRAGITFASVETVSSITIAALQATGSTKLTP